MLMDACMRYDVGRFHQISTDEVYGDLPLDRSDLLFTEESPICPSSPYSSSKAAADLWLWLIIERMAHRLPSAGVQIIIPYQYPEKLIPLMVTNALADRPLPVYGQGINVRDWIHVDDHCRAIDAILTQGKVGEIYNVGGHCERTNIDIVRMICRNCVSPSH